MMAQRYGSIPLVFGVTLPLVISLSDFLLATTSALFQANQANEMNNKTIRILAFVVVLLVSCTNMGCTWNEISGLVVDLAGNPIATARVEQLDNPLETITDSSGVFRLPWLGAEAHVEVRAEGYLPVRGPVSRSLPLSTPNQFVLWPDGAPGASICILDLAGAHFVTLPEANTLLRASTRDTPPGIVVQLPTDIPNIALVDGLAIFVDGDPRPIQLFRLDESGSFLQSADASTGSSARRPLPVKDVMLPGIFPVDVVRAARIRPGLYCWAEVHPRDRSRLLGKGTSLVFRATEPLEAGSPGPLTTFRLGKKPFYAPRTTLPLPADLLLLEKFGLGGALERVAANRIMRQYDDDTLVNTTAEALLETGHRQQLERLSVLYTKLVIPPQPPTPGASQEGAAE